jgi:hypothetical protein
MMTREEKDLQIYCAALTGAISQLGSFHVQSVDCATRIARNAVSAAYNHDSRAPRPILALHPEAE